MSQKRRHPLRPSLFDRALAVVSPSRAIRRLQDKAAFQAISTGSVTRKGGGSDGTVGNWIVKRLSRFTETAEREKLVDRADDLVANDCHAASVVDSTTVSVVGSGLRPQSKPNHKILGITEEQAAEIAEQAEWAYKLWDRKAGADGHSTGGDLQFQVVRSMLGKGELLALPVMLDDPAREFSLAIQTLEPTRLRTPYDVTSADVRDGIQLTRGNAPTAYWIATPQNRRLSYNLTSADFTRIPATIGHRPQVLHGFHKKDPEQVRGVSILAPAMKFFRDLSDYLDFEIVGNIMAASFPLWIETADPYQQSLVRQETGTAASAKTRYQEVAAGSIYYGNSGEKPHVLKSERQGGTFDRFVEVILRAMGAASGLPYEVVAKDFSKTSYSSARAAFEEAYKTFRLYQQWLIPHYCQPTWDMVFEEAWLRGMITLPAGAPDFYDARAAYTNALWIPPKRGSLDPVKEIMAAAMAKANNLLTDADWYAEQGRDVEEQYRQLAKEQKMRQANDLPEASGPSKKTVNSQPAPQPATE